MDTSHMPVIELKGTARERGQAHGEALRPRIAESLARWRADIAAAYDSDVDGFIVAFLGATRFPAALERWTPGLLEEIEGIAAGAGQPGRDILALQFMDEQWWFNEERKAAAAAPSLSSEGKNCTAFGDAEARRGTTLMGQTMDIAPWSEGLQALLHIHEADGTETYVFTTAGFLGLLGVNSHGVGICCNALLQLDHSDDGLPVAAVVRGVLGHHDAEGAAAFLRRIRHASGQNYLLGGPGTVMSLECSAKSVVPYVPADGGTRICHTNHPLSNEDTALCRARLGKSAHEPLDFGGPNSARRLAAIERRLGDPDRAVSLADLKAALASEDDPKHPIARRLDPAKPNAIGYTAGTAIYELKDPPVLYLAAGPASTTSFRAFRFAATARSAA